MRRFVLDTNIILYFLGGRLAESLPVGSYVISVISELELLAYPGLASAEEQRVRSFLSDIAVTDLTQTIKGSRCESSQALWREVAGFDRGCHRPGVGGDLIDQRSTVACIDRGSDTSTSCQSRIVSSKPGRKVGALGGRRAQRTNQAALNPLISANTTDSLCSR